MADIHDTIEQLYPDNEQALITPEALRAGLHALASLGPNQRNDLWKSVRFLTRAEATADGYGGEVFEELDFSKLCVYSTVLVEFYRETPASSLEHLVRLVAVYDGEANPRYHLQRTASFAEQGVTVPAKFVRADSLEAQLANIPFYKPGATYKVDDAVQYTNGPTLVYVAKQAGKLPAPSSTQGDAYWQPTVPAVAEISFSQGLTVMQARELAAAGQLKTNRLYVLFQRVDNTNSPLDDVRVAALTESELAPIGWEMRGAGQEVQVRYELASDTTTEISSLTADQKAALAFSVARCRAPSISNPYMTYADGFLFNLGINGALNSTASPYANSSVTIFSGTTAITVNLPVRKVVDVKFALRMDAAATAACTISWTNGKVDGAATTIMQPGEWRLFACPADPFGTNPDFVTFWRGNNKQADNGAAAYDDTALKQRLETVRTTLAASATQTGSYTLLASDAGNVVPINSAASSTVTVPADSTVNFAVGTVLEVSQEGTGQVVLAAASGATVTSYGGLKTAGQYAALGLRKTSANTWRVTGGVA